MENIIILDLQLVKIRKNHTNEKHGKLLLIAYVGSKISSSNGSGSQYYNCLCDCGETTTVVYQSLKSGITKTCGKCPTIKGKERSMDYGKVTEN
jgi:hypothetical protein